MYNMPQRPVLKSIKLTTLSNADHDKAEASERFNKRGTIPLNSVLNPSSLIIVEKALYTLVYFDFNCSLVLTTSNG